MEKRITQPKTPAGIASARTRDSLAKVGPAFETMVAKMNTPLTTRAGDALFSASGEVLGALAQAYARGGLASDE